MRIYVMVTKMKPLTILLYKEGIARFSSDRYDTKHLGNLFSHLTNTSINKQACNHQNLMSGAGFGSGIKWTFEQMKSYFRVILSLYEFWYSIGLKTWLEQALGQDWDHHCANIDQSCSWSPRLRLLLRAVRLWCNNWQQHETLAAGG